MLTLALAAGAEIPVGVGEIVIYWRPWVTDPRALTLCRDTLGDMEDVWIIGHVAQAIVAVCTAATLVMAVAMKLRRRLPTRAASGAAGADDVAVHRASPGTVAVACSWAGRVRR